MIQNPWNLAGILPGWIGYDVVDRFRSFEVVGTMCADDSSSPRARHGCSHRIDQQ